jgi:DNA polymerase-3 subunit delta'
MLKLLEVASGHAPFAEWAKYAEAIAPRKQEKLELFLAVLYVLLEDLLALTLQSSDIRNSDIRRDLEKLAAGVSFNWIRLAVKKIDELSELVRRNIQKTIALDALALELRRSAA